MKKLNQLKSTILGLTALNLLVGWFPAAQATVYKENRALVIVSELDSRGMRELRPLYQTLENITVGVARDNQFTGDQYGTIRVLSGSSATFARFKSTLRDLAANSNIKAIDTIVSLHGSPGSLAFADGTWDLGRMKDLMLLATDAPERALVQILRHKLRFLYSLACFGASHRVDWSAMGYDIVVGAVGVNANSEIEYPSVLRQWSESVTVIDAFGQTNNDTAIALADAPIKLAGEMAGNALKYTNSKKYFMGDLSVRIFSDPR